MHAWFYQAGSVSRQKSRGLILISILLADHGVQVAAKIDDAPGYLPGRPANGSEEAGETIAPWAGSRASPFENVLFGEPPEVVRLLADSASAHRRVQAAKVISNELDYTRTSFAFTFKDDIEPPLQCQPTDCQPAATGIYAGVTISQIEIIVDPDSFNAPGAKFRVVRDIVDKAGAQASGLCRPGSYENGLHIANVNHPWAGNGATGINPNGGGSMEIKLSRAIWIPLTFKMGGIFKLCYSNDGSFQTAHADIVPFSIEVYGIYDTRTECATDETCLTKRAYRCYLMRQAFNNYGDSYSAKTSCILDYSYDGAGFTGLPGMGSWTGPFATSYDAGMVTSVTPRTCGGEGDSNLPATFLCNSGDSCGALADPRVPFITPNASVGSRQIVYPPGRNDLLYPTDFKAYSVAACYCPDFQKCNSFSPDYVQQVGILHYYVSKVCPNGIEAFECSLDFTGAAPQHRFALRVECPTDACGVHAANRVKIVKQEVKNDLPSWDPSSGCGAAVHGVNVQGVLVFPPDDNLDVAVMNGGTRQDFRIWNPKNSSSGELDYDTKTSGFLFRMGSSDHELRSRYSGETFDVCYCDSTCLNIRNWFKVGQMRFAPLQPVSSASNVSITQNEFAIEYMNQPGIFGFYRPWVDYGVMGLQEGGSLKFVVDSGLKMKDADCVTAAWDRTLVEDGFGQATADTSFRGVTDLSRDENKLLFNGEVITNRITVKKAGFLAVCYCARPLGAGVCAHNQWVLANRITIRGPGPGQSWVFSTHVVFRIEFAGFGFDKDDKLRIIPGTSECSELDGDPRGAFGVTNIKVGCPYPCSEVGEVNDVLNGDIGVSVLSDSTYLCNDQNSDCRSNDIKAARVLDENRTEIEFESNPLLANGDLISLDDNYACNPVDSINVCNEERLSVLRGRYSFADHIANHNSAPNEYISGHRVTLDPTDGKKVTIPIGWPDPKPRFDVQYKNAKRGRWTRHSKAITKQEITGTRERLDMKICWKYTPAMGLEGPSPRYVAEVGTLSLIDSNPMAECIISLTTLVKKQTSPFAPFILSFKTATAETGKRYTSVQGPTQLRIYFVRTVAFYTTFVDGATIENNEGENEVGEARQYVCGKIFKELWSSDDLFGFPMPRGCYYRAYGQTQELNLVFDQKNGLSPGKYYQLVMNGVAMDEAVTDGEYAQIFTSDDMDTLPYTAIERGIAKLYRAPQEASYGSEGVRFFSPDGIKISTGSGTEMLELKGGTALRLALKGDIQGGGIKANSILRLWLWPLTQWDVANRCTATCIPYDQVSYPCGAVQDCKGDAVIPNFQQNYLRLVLPATMTTMTEFVSHTLEFPELQLPKGGFFASRLAAQISKADDTKPHYTVSVGDFIYKLPEEGVAVGKLVDVYGDGDQRPFKGDSQNLVYVNIVLAATLFSAVQTGDAFMTLTLPPGYECVRSQDVNGMSPWRTEDTLQVFGDNIPQGTGSPDEGGGTRGWSVKENTCTYSLRQNAVIYAGSSLYIRVTVNNPETALKRMDTSNRWQVNLTSKGSHQYPVTFPSVIFKTDGGKFSQNKAVLGKIQYARISPTNFRNSLGPNSISAGYLSVFFQTEQGTGVSSSVHLQAPTGFLFEPCEVTDLEDVYYGTPGQTGKPTSRLPGIVSCLYQTVPFNHAQIKLSGALLSQSYYGFRIGVQNALNYQASQRDGWRIFTLDDMDYRVDGTPDTVPAVEHNASALLAMSVTSTKASFGLYRSQLNDQEVNRVQVKISDTLPFAMSGKREVVTVRPLKVPVGMKATLRVIAPIGYMWEFADAEFRWQAALANSTPSLIIQDTTAHLPGRVPIRSANVLLWNTESQYLPNETYGFEAFIRVPDRTPTASLNEFLFEFGYDGDSLATRYAASSVPAIPVRALINARLEYTTNVESKVNDLIFQLETITAVPSGGAISMVGPPGFELPEVCNFEVPSKARGSEYQVEPTIVRTMRIPMDAECKATVTVDSTEIRIIAGPTGVPAGLYRFKLISRNPKNVVSNLPDPSTPCGYELCWHFQSLKVIGAGPDLDKPISVPAFSINKKIVQALFPRLTLVQQAATGRNDRPLERNPLVFAFKLTGNALFPGVMLIRGPIGTIFREDCMEDVETRPGEVFGVNQPLPAEYGAWPQGVAVVSCRGEGPDAMIYLDPGITNGLLAEVLYAIRVAVLSNPLTQPADSRWTFDYNGESSDPFDGYSLWTFTRTSLLKVSSGRSSAVTGEASLMNPVTFTFRPLNTVKGTGMIIKVTAPESFSIVQQNTYCNILMQPVSVDAQGFANADPSTAPEPNYIGPPSLIWGDADVNCVVDSMTGRVMTATVLAESRELTGGRDYQLTLFVRNPQITVNDGSWNYWVLETYDSPAGSGVLPTFRDLVTLHGYAVFDKTKQFLYRNQDPLTGVMFRNGLTAIPGLFVQFQMPSKIQPGDVIAIAAPVGYMFKESPALPGKCLDFQWEPIQDAYLYLPNSNITCNMNRIEFLVKEPRDIPELRLMQFRIDAMNPASTPHVMLNHFSITHTAMAGGIIATDAALSWKVVPQLYNVKVNLVGREKAEMSMSSMAISYMPVSDADELMLQALLPTGFDFTGATTMSSGHEVIATSVETVRIRAAMYSAVNVDIVIANFRLGMNGGNTVFNLVTKLNNGVQMDEENNFQGGFRLPGRVRVLGKSISSLFKLDPVLFPVASLWEARMGEDAVVDFSFTLTMTASIGNMLRIRAPPYDLKPTGFTIIQQNSGDIVTAEVISASSGELVARLGMSIFPAVAHKVSLAVKTPNVPNPTDAMWAVEVLDGGLLAENTNDYMTEGFQLVDRVELTIRAAKSPPLAEVDAEVTFDPKSASPDELIIVAPAGFNFTADCLISGGDNKEVKSCVYMGNIAGRAAARLSTIRLTSILQYVVIRIKTPAQSPAEPSWFVEARDATSNTQLGWGEDPTGVSVRQMDGAKVVYPGIPSISGQMAFQFITNEKLDAGGILRVGYPKDITIQCGGSYLQQVALEGYVSCQNNAREGFFQLTLSRPLPPGQQAFAVESTCPTTVINNQFYIIVMTNQNQVVDAAMSIPGLPIQHGFSLAALDLIWGNAEPNRATFISMGFELLTELPLKDPPIMAEIVVTLPKDFFHQVMRSSHVETMAKPLPKKIEGGWLDVTNPTVVRVLLDETLVSTLAVGQYRFQFPILVPGRMPKYNVWTMTICAPTRMNVSCTGPTDPRALVSFPMAGFNMGQSHPSAVAFSTTGDSTGLRASILLWLVLPLLVHGFVRPRQS